MKNLSITKIIDNIYVRRSLFIIPLFNLIRSYYYLRKEQKIFIEIINENDDFFKSLITMNFKPSVFGQFIAALPYDKGLSPEDIIDIANKTVIAIVLKYVKDENLLGIIKVDCDIVKNHVIVSIKPVHLSLVLIDAVDLIIALIFNTIIALAIYFYIV